MSITSIKCECSCMICPNIENFCPNNGQFSSFGDTTASHAIRLWVRAPQFRGATSSSFRGANDVIVLIQPCYNFSQTVTYNNNVFLPADMKSIPYKHTHSAQRWLIKNSVLQQRWRLNYQCQAKFLTSRHMRMHRATFYILNTLRKLMIRT